VLCDGVALGRRVHEQLRIGQLRVEQFQVGPFGTGKLGTGQLWSVSRDIPVLCSRVWMLANQPDELADSAKGGGRGENHGAPRIRRLFA
jgi:hypothetical protein